jgi:3-dehydroquinate synthase
MQMETLHVGLGERSYPIHIGEDILGEIGVELLAISFPKKIAVVTNPLVGGLYADVVLNSLRVEGFSPVRIDIPDGEEFKTLATVSTVYDALVATGFDRGCGLLALGGGVIGDLAGFVAATFLRGIPFVQIPTTLLAQVDSSVGGKTGVNHPRGKNLIGAFYQPRLVLIDVNTLATLSSRDYHAGFAEVVKYGVIRDQTFFSELAEHAGKLCDHDPVALITAIKRSCQIKADIVERDEREDGLRAILNYGHTFGHAIENLAGYGEYRHGEAVAIGMVVAAQISATLGLCTLQEVEAIRQLLLDFKLPILSPVYSTEKLLEAIGRDKKVHTGLLRMILNRGIGDYEIRTVVDPGALFSGLTSSCTAE